MLGWESILGRAVPLEVEHSPIYEYDVGRYARFLETSFLPKGVRIIHVSSSESMPKRGIVCCSAILLGDPDTGIYKKDTDSEGVGGWRDAYVCVPKQKGWAESFFYKDTYSKRKGKRRFIPASRRVGGVRVRNNEAMSAQVDSLEECLLRTEGYNEIWVNSSTVAFIYVKVRQLPGEPVEIKYPDDEAKQLGLV